jgi:hypothetical protein
MNKREHIISTYLKHNCDTILAARELSLSHGDLLNELKKYRTCGWADPAEQPVRDLDPQAWEGLPSNEFRVMYIDDMANAEKILKRGIHARK